jgi:molybdopterin synthase catalytic subunit
MTIRLTARPLSVPAAYAALGDERSGGVVVFAGRVRPDVTRLGRVHSLDYEAHRPLALASLRRLAVQARQRYGARRVVLWHRVGRLRVGTVSVIVGVATPHRADAFAAARYLIDALKRETPIWKTDRGRPGRPRPSRPARRSAR